VTASSSATPDPSLLRSLGAARCVAVGEGARAAPYAVIFRLGGAGGGGGGRAQSQRGSRSVELEVLRLECTQVLTTAVFRMRWYSG
jgi:hypothetical protein